MATFQESCDNGCSNAPAAGIILEVCTAPKRNFENFNGYREDVRNYVYCTCIKHEVSCWPYLVTIDELDVGLLFVSSVISTPAFTLIENEDFMTEFSATWLCSVGYVQTVPEIFTPGITLQRTSVSSLGHSYPYPEILNIMYGIHTCTRNFWKFCTPVAKIPGIRVPHVLYPLGTSVSSVRLCHNTRKLWKFCKTSIPVPRTAGSSLRPTIMGNIFSDYFSL